MLPMPTKFFNSSMQHLFRGGAYLGVANYAKFANATRQVGKVITKGQIIRVRVMAIAAAALHLPVSILNNIVLCARLWKRRSSRYLSPVSKVSTWIMWPTIQGRLSCSTKASSIKNSVFNRSE